MSAAINGNSDCCKNCPNRIIEGEIKSTFYWQVPPDVEFPNISYSIKTKPMIDVIKENIEGLTIKELKELMEYMKKFEGLK